VRFDTENDFLNGSITPVLTCAGLPFGFNAQRLYSRTVLGPYAFIASYGGGAGGGAIGLSQNPHFHPNPGGVASYK